MRTLLCAAGLVVLCACGDSESDESFFLGGTQFHVDFDLNHCTADGTLQFSQAGNQVTGTLDATRRCAGVDTDLSGPISAGTLEGTQLSFTADTEPAECTFTGEESRDGTNEELRGMVECGYADGPYTGIFVAFRTQELVQSRGF